MEWLHDRKKSGTARGLWSPFKLLIWNPLHQKTYVEMIPTVAITSVARYDRNIDYSKGSIIPPLPALMAISTHTLYVNFFI